MTPRIFTVEEVNSLVPELARRVGDLLARAADIRGRIESLELLRNPDRIDQGTDQRTGTQRIARIAQRTGTQRSQGSGQRTTRGAGGVNLEPTTDDDDHVRAHKIDLLAAIETYERGWREVQDLGAVVKDPHTGLCDFYGRIDGRLVCLCWRYGEHAIDHYHEIDGGFSSRKPLGASLRQRMLN